MNRFALLYNLLGQLFPEFSKEIEIFTFLSQIIWKHYGNFIDDRVEATAFGTKHGTIHDDVIFHVDLEKFQRIVLVNRAGQNVQQFTFQNSVSAPLFFPCINLQNS